MRTPSASQSCRGPMPVPRPPHMSRRCNSITSNTLQAGDRVWKRRCSAPVRAVIGKEHHRWPEFVDAAQRVGIRASLSVPLLIGGLDQEQELVGSLNIYSHTASAFDPFDAQRMRLYTVAAGQAITNAGRWQHSRETVTQLETALHSRSDIDMAKGVLIALHRCEPGEAFTRLVEESQRRNIKLRDVALELLDRTKTTA